MSSPSGGCAPRRRVLLIGIGGSSASGKSTLAAGLAKELNSPLNGFSADHYLDIKRVRSVGSWETPAGIAWDDLRAALEDTKATLARCERLPPSLVVGGFSRGPLELVPRGQGGKQLGSDPAVVIIEGFLLFSDKKLCDMLDLAIWIDTDCETCARRRYDREGRWGSYDRYKERFCADVWHHYELYKGDQLANVPKVQRLDGALAPVDVASQAVVHCRLAVDCSRKEPTGAVEDDHQIETPFKESAVPVHRRVILIGIGGSSASGKSTLTAGLVKELNSPLKGFSADHYLDFARVQRVGSWETPAGIAWDELREALRSTVNTLAQSEHMPRSLRVGGFSRGALELVPNGQGGKLLGSEPLVVIVEGFLLFCDKKLCDMLDLAIWIDTDCEMCARRRYNREGRRGEFSKYVMSFREEVWYHHELNKGQQLENVPKVRRVDGALEPPSMLVQAAAHCKEVLDSGSKEEMSKTDAKKSKLNSELASLSSKIDTATAKSSKLKGEVKELQAELAALAKAEAEGGSCSDFEERCRASS